jgi:hypothetical protein
VVAILRTASYWRLPVTWSFTALAMRSRMDSYFASGQRTLMGLT